MPLQTKKLCMTVQALLRNQYRPQAHPRVREVFHLEEMVSVLSEFAGRSIGVIHSHKYILVFASCLEAILASDTRSASLLPMPLRLAIAHKLMGTTADLVDEADATEIGFWPKYFFLTNLMLSNCLRQGFYVIFLLLVSCPR